MDIHHSKKIVFRQVGNPEPIFAFDEFGFATLNTMYSIVINDRTYEYPYLLAILNSSLTKSFFLSKYSDGKQLFPKIKGFQLKELPIKIVDEMTQSQLIEKANQMLDLNKELQEKKNTFLNRLKDNFELDRISNKVDAFYNFDFKTLLSELKKRKVMLSLIQQDEWEEYFMAYKTEINALQAQINQTDNEIDQLVDELYGLTQDEIKIVEEASV